MNISKELFEKAKQAKTAEELLEMAKAVLIRTNGWIRIIFPIKPYDFTKMRS